jgi:hypothetical protein
MGKKEEDEKAHLECISYYESILKLPEGLGDFSTFLKHFRDYQKSEDFNNKICPRTLKITLCACQKAEKIEKCEQMYLENTQECDKRVALLKQCREMMSNIKQSPLEITFKKIVELSSTCQKLLDTGKLLQKRLGDLLNNWHTQLLNYGKNEKSGKTLTSFLQSCMSFKDAFEKLKSDNPTDADITEAYVEFFRSLMSIEMEFKKNDKIVVDVTETKTWFEKLYKHLDHQATSSCILCKDNVACDLFNNMCSNHYYDSVLMPKIFTLKNQTHQIDWDDVHNEELEKHLENVNKITTEEITDTVLISTTTLKKLENSISYLEKALPSLKQTVSSISSQEEDDDDEDDVITGEEMVVTKKRPREDEDDETKLKKRLNILIDKKPKNTLQLLKVLKDEDYNLFDKMTDDISNSPAKCFIIVGCIKEDGLTEIRSCHPTWDDAKKNLPKETEYLKYKIHKILN